MRPFILVLAVLGGCSSVVPTGLARLSAVSPLQADPADIAVALSLPDGVRIVENSTVMKLAATRSDTEETTDETYSLSSMMKSDGRQIYAVASADYVRLRKQQALIRQWENADAKSTSGSLSVTLEGCKFGLGPEDSATVSIDVRTSADGRFFPLVREASVKDALEMGGHEPLQTCPRFAN